MPNLRTQAISLISTTTGIDATTVATTKLYEPPPDQSFIPILIVTRLTALTADEGDDELRSWAMVSFGGNSPAYNDFADWQTYRLGAANQYLVHKPENLSRLPIYDHTTPFYIVIEAASDATTEVWAVDLFGYLI